LDPLGARRLTLTRGLEAEGLEAPGEGGGVDDVDAVLALAPPVESDGDDQQHHRHHPRSEARVQGHVAAALHTWGESAREREKQIFERLFSFAL